MQELMGFGVYQLFVFVHLLLFVLWLGADVGVNMLGQHFRKRDQYDLPQRVILLKLLVNLDMIPRTAWALMVPVSITMLSSGGYWQVPVGVLAFVWVIGAVWTWLIWDSHLHDQTPRATRNRRIESWLKYALTLFYLGLGTISLIEGAPLASTWLAAKAIVFGLIFVAAIMIDIRFKPVGPLLVKLLEEGSSDATEGPLLKTMNRSRIWVWVVYGLLVVIAFLGNVKPML